MFQSTLAASEVAKVLPELAELERTTAATTLAENDVARNEQRVETFRTEKISFS